MNFSYLLLVTMVMHFCYSAQFSQIKFSLERRIDEDHYEMLVVNAQLQENVYEMQIYEYDVILSYGSVEQFEKLLTSSQKYENFVLDFARIKFSLENRDLQFVNSDVLKFIKAFRRLHNHFFYEKDKYYIKQYYHVLRELHTQASTREKMLKQRQKDKRWKQIYNEQQSVYLSLEELQILRYSSTVYADCVMIVMNNTSNYDRRVYNEVFNRLGQSGDKFKEGDWTGWNIYKVRDGQDGYRRWEMVGDIQMEKGRENELIKDVQRIGFRWDGQIYECEKVINKINRSDFRWLQRKYLYNTLQQSYKLLTVRSNCSSEQQKCWDHKDLYELTSDQKIVWLRSKRDNGLILMGAFILVHEKVNTIQEFITIITQHLKLPVFSIVYQTRILFTQTFTNLNYSEALNTTSTNVL